MRVSDMGTATDTQDNVQKLNPGGALRAAHREAAKAKRAGTVTPLDAKNGKTKPDKTPAKKAPPKVVRDAQHPWYVRTGYKAVPGQKLWEATGRSGQIAVRSHTGEMKFAVCWAQPGHNAEPVQKGTIYNFYVDRAAAEKAGKSLIEGRPGDTYQVVEARPYQGQPGDKDAKVAVRKPAEEKAGGK